MYILGAIIIALGIGSVFYGNELNSSIEAQMEAVWNTGKANPGNIWLILGAIAIVIGVILIIFQYIKNNGTAIASKSHAPVERDRVSSGAVETITDEISTIVKQVKQQIVKYTPKSAKCSNCGNIIHEGASFCPKCGKPVIKESSKSTCPHCGKKLSGSPAFCPYCGKSLKEPVTSPEQPPETTKPGWSVPSDNDL
jgi:predicted Zn-ribbon and HTH transcriptional regulator